MPFVQLRVVVPSKGNKEVLSKLKKESELGGVGSVQEFFDAVVMRAQRANFLPADAFFSSPVR